MQKIFLFLLVMLGFISVPTEANPTQCLKKNLTTEDVQALYAYGLRLANPAYVQGYLRSPDAELQKRIDVALEKVNTCQGNNDDFYAVYDNYFIQETEKAGEEINSDTAQNNLSPLSEYINEFTAHLTLKSRVVPAVCPKAIEWTKTDMDDAARYAMMFNAQLPSAHSLYKLNEKQQLDAINAISSRLAQKIGGCLTTQPKEHLRYYSEWQSLGRELLDKTQ